MSDDPQRGMARDEPADRSLLVLAALTLGHIAVVWGLRFLPTYDGPAHLASAVVWAELGRPETRYREFYVFAPKQVPNLTSQFILAGLVHVMPPLIAEKVLVTIYVVGFAAAFWYFAAAFGGDARWLSPLGLLFVFNGAFRAGFYNYCLSLIAFWYVAGFCARHSKTMTISGAATLAVVLTAGYCTHLVGWLLSVVTAFWFAAPLRRGQARNLLYLPLAAAPSSLLALDYGIRTALMGDDGLPIAINQALCGANVALLEQRFAALGENSLGASAAWCPAFGWAVFVLYQVLTAATLASANAHRAAASTKRGLPLAAALFAAYCVLPDHLGRHGGFLLVRIAFLPPMLIVCALRLPAVVLARRAAIALVYAAVCFNLASAAHEFRRANDDIEQYVSGIEAVGRDAAIFTASPPGGTYWPDFLKHAACYYCLTTGDVALENYQGERGPFWVQLRSGIHRGGGEFAAYPNKAVVDFVLAWHDKPADPRPPEGCCEVFRNGRLRVYATRQGLLRVKELAVRAAAHETN